MNNPIFGLLKQGNIDKLHLNEKDARKGFYKNDIIIKNGEKFQGIYFILHGIVEEDYYNMPERKTEYHSGELVLLEHLIHKD